jgi:hypothetical protein
MDVLNGKKTYILVALAAIGALATYASSVITNGFDLGAFWAFIQSEAMVLVFATIRAAIAKK